MNKSGLSSRVSSFELSLKGQKKARQKPRKLQHIGTTYMTKHDSTSWDIDQSVEIKTGEGRSIEDLETRRELVIKVSDIAQKEEWSKAETARQIGMADGTLNQFLSGKYPGRFDKINTTIKNWLSTYEQSKELAGQIPVSPDYISTEFAKEVEDALTAAHIMPAMVMVSADAGFGKTYAARRYALTRPNVYMVTISPYTKTVHACLQEVVSIVAEGAGVNNMVRTIGNRLKRTGGGTLLIVDECQNLNDDAINQLRHFLDQYQCGIALLGNSETYTRFKTNWSDLPKYSQLKRRIFKRISRTKPKLSDIKKFIKAWGITEDDQVEFLTGVGMKPGALGQIDMTIKLAKLVANGERVEVNLSHLKSAWKNRDVEGV